MRAVMSEPLRARGFDDDRAVREAGDDAVADREVLGPRRRARRKLA